MVSFTKEVNPWLAKRPLVFNGRLANRGLNSLVKEATDIIAQFIYQSCSRGIQTISDGVPADILAYINGLVQERHNSVANTLELCLSW